MSRRRDRPLLHKRFEGVSIPPPSDEMPDEVVRDRWGITTVAWRRKAEELVAKGATLANYGEVYHAMAWLDFHEHDLSEKNIIDKADRLARQRLRLEQRLRGETDGNA